MREMIIYSNSIDLKKTFECGQAFRWHSDSKQLHWSAVLDHSLVVLIQETERITLIETGNHTDDWWYNFLDLNFDYGYLEQLNLSAFERKALLYSKGIKILRQDLWETFVSFIISQQNNIPRIKRFVDSLCRNYGNVVHQMNDNCYYDFPSHERLADIGIVQLRKLGLGYRAEYVDYAAKHWSAELENNLLRMNSSDAVYTLKQFYGVGSKIANCVDLFALHHLDSFPIDIWISRVMSRYPEINPHRYGELAGVMQQYLYYYGRNVGI